ncbi:MAG TPA: excisionase family DNA-binding protein [Chitinophagaceae bacterium]|nr:excisionase family DNA-binding protein [Chitinophagaceae bacterium]
METGIRRISKENQQIAQISLTAIRSKSRQLKKMKHGTVHIRINNADIVIPSDAFVLLSDILSNTAEGKSVSVIPVETQISTQQAANILNVSRPFLVKLLETGEMPFFKIGSHRRLLLKDVREYEQKQKNIRKKHLAFLAKQAQDLNMGY